MTKFTIVSHKNVENAIQRAKEELRQDPKEYNTHHHSYEEISRILPDLVDRPLSSRPWLLLSPWLDLIKSSRGLDNEVVHCIELKGGFFPLLQETSKVALRMDHIPADDEEDLAVSFPKKTTAGLEIEDVIQKAPYFVRMDACSLKDAQIGGPGPVQSVRDLYTRLTTSQRGMMGVNDQIDHLRSAGEPVRILMYLFPWDETMQANLEYRVFCPPSSGGTERSTKGIAAISQYRWHETWSHSKKTRAEQGEIAERLVKNCQQLYDQVIHHDLTIASRGFVFDVVENPDNQAVRLIELNEFGAQSGCGSCLYHWIEDARILYGREEGIEVRVSV